MLFSRTSEYAVQALIYVAMQPRDEPVLNRQIAEHLHVPAAYLAKVMQTLCKSGLLYSYRGRQGGFLLREGAEKTSLLTILKLTEGPDFADNCLLGLKVCSDETACPVHFRWKPIKEKIVGLLEAQTLDKLARSVKTGKYRLSDMPSAPLEEALPPPQVRTGRASQSAFFGLEKEIGE